MKEIDNIIRDIILSENYSKEKWIKSCLKEAKPKKKLKNISKHYLDKHDIKMFIKKYSDIEIYWIEQNGKKIGDYYIYGLDAPF